MAAIPYGTFNLQDLIAAQTPVLQFGEDNAFAAIQAAFDAHNRIVADIARPLVDKTTDNMRRYGGPAPMQLVRMDQWARPDAQKVTAGSNVGFPLEFFGMSLQWTRWALERMRTDELAAQVTGAMDADLKNIQLLFKTALFTPTNSTFVDKLSGTFLQLPIKALVNADGAPLPVGPNGEVYNASTHTHYLGVATGGIPLVSEVAALIETVIEHYASGQPLLYINRAQETTVRAMAGFAQYFDNRVTAATTITRGDGELNPVAIYNRPIGILDGAEVWTKPWIPAGYMLAFMDNGLKPLAWRGPEVGSGEFRLLAENEQYPLRAQSWGREIGVAVWNRPNGSVLDCTTGGGTFTQPVLTVV